MPSFVHTTKAQFAAALRARYRTATGIEAVKIGRYFVASGVFSDADLKAAFGLPTAAAVNSLKGRLQAQAVKLSAVEQAVGE